MPIPSNLWKAGLSYVNPPVLPNTLHPFPQIPVEVGQRIIEFAAASDRQTAVSLSSACKAFQQWSQKGLFERIWLADKTMVILYNLLVKEKPSALLTEGLIHTKYLGTRSEFNPHPLFPALFNLCTNLQEIEFHSSIRVVVPAQATFPNLSRLTGHAWVFTLNDLSPFDEGPDLDCPVFHHLTHLRLHTTLCPAWNLSKFPHLITLTHLRLPFGFLFFMREIKTLLNHQPPALQVLIAEINLDFGIITQEAFESFMALYEGQVDSRVVVAATTSSLVQIASVFANGGPVFFPWAINTDFELRGRDDFPAMRTWQKSEDIVKERSGILEQNFD